MVLRPGHGGFAVAGERRALMLTRLRQRKVARGVFDESHGEAWSIRPDTAAALRPEHPAAASYAAAAALAERDFEVATHTGGSLAGGVLDDEFPLSTFYLKLQKKLAHMAEAAREPAHA
jgi:hypothetical protein